MPTDRDRQTDGQTDRKERKPGAGLVEAERDRGRRWGGGEAGQGRARTEPASLIASRTVEIHAQNEEQHQPFSVQKHLVSGRHDVSIRLLGQSCSRFMPGCIHKGFERCAGKKRR